MIKYFQRTFYIQFQRSRNPFRFFFFLVITIFGASFLYSLIIGFVAGGKGVSVEEIDNSINNFSSSEENLIESSVAEENIETGLVEYEANKFIVAARRLTPIYKFQKRVKLFFYKAFNTIPKVLSEQFGFNSNEDK